MWRPPSIIYGGPPTFPLEFMGATVNLSEAARRLGVTYKTIRKRISPSYKGSDAIFGAVKRGRDWIVPVSEIERVTIVTSGGRSLIGKDLYAQMVTLDSIAEYSRAARNQLESAARAFVAQLDTQKAAKRDYLTPLREALRAYDNVNIMFKVFEGVRRRTDSNPKRAKG